LWAVAVGAVLLLVTACALPPLHSTTAARIPVENDVIFFERDGNRIQVDIYQPDQGGRHPAVIVLHGSGGIHLLADRTAARYAQALAEQGMVAFVVHYFDATGDFTANDSVETTNYFRWVRALRDVITRVRQRPDVRANSIGLLGHSLGAWLAVGAAAMDRRVNRIVLFGAGLEPFLADSIKRMPPTLMFHGGKDDVVPVSDADTLAAFMRRRGYPLEYHVLPDEGHTLSDSAASEALTRAARFLVPRRQRWQVR
jgi:dienelactone hydrolase